MHIEGKISYIGPVQTGTSQRGTNWKKQEFAVTYQEGRYPLAILFPTLDENIIGKLQIGQTVSVDFDCEVRPYQGKDGTQRMFNNFTIWRNGLHCLQQATGISQNVGQPAQSSAPQQAQPAQQPANQAPQQQEPKLPF